MDKMINELLDKIHENLNGTSPSKYHLKSIENCIYYLDELKDNEKKETAKVLILNYLQKLNDSLSQNKKLEVSFHKEVLPIFLIFQNELNFIGKVGFLLFLIIGITVSFILFLLNVYVFAVFLIIYCFFTFEMIKEESKKEKERKIWGYRY